MKIIMTGRGSRQRHFGTSQVERLLCWLAGFDSHAFSVAEKLVSENMPPGITLQQANAEQLGHATKVAMETYNQQAEEIVKFAFSLLSGCDVAKGEAVIQSVISVIPAESVPKFVRIAVRARPSLSLTIAKTAATLLPEQMDRIASAVESIVTTAY
jgi:hypothetical protein